MGDKKYLDVLISIISIILLIELVVLAVAITGNSDAVELNADATSEVDVNKQVEENNTENENAAKYAIENIDINEIDGFYIKVNYQENVVTIYIKDSEGNFTIPYKAMVCSTGTATPTSGVYKMSDRGVWGMMVGRVWAQYYSRIDGQILFHSVPYSSKSPNKLEYWEYDKLGTTASAGCVRLTVEDSKWIYENCPAGTEVEFYADSNPGPLGKPEANKISEAPENLRGWDPTDPNPNNPWNNY